MQVTDKITITNEDCMELLKRTTRGQRIHIAKQRRAI